MPRCVGFRALILGALVAATGCSGFDKDGAAAQIRDQFCGGWPYGCTDSTRVVVEKVRKTNRGRQVEFRVVDRDDETATLSSAYFESDDDGWRFFLFENPFKDHFDSQAARVSEESSTYSDQLRELKAAQNWFVSIYDRYAESFEELDSVSYEPPALPITMTVLDGQGWRAEITSQFVRCELDAPRQQLPTCVGLAAENAGSVSGPLSQMFGRTP